MPIGNRFSFVKDNVGYPARPNEPFHTEMEVTVPLPKRGSGTVLELGCGCEPRIVQSIWFMKPGEGL